MPISTRIATCATFSSYHATIVSVLVVVAQSAKTTTTTTVSYHETSVGISATHKPAQSLFERVSTAVAGIATASAIGACFGKTRIAITKGTCAAKYGFQADLASEFQRISGDGKFGKEFFAYPLFFVLGGVIVKQDNAF